MGSKNKQYSYGYTIADDADRTAADQSGDKFDENKYLQGRAELVETPLPDRKAMRYLPSDISSGDDKDTGAGRGKVNPPNAYKKGGKVRSSASKRADGIITKGHTKGKYL